MYAYTHIHIFVLCCHTTALLWQKKKNTRFASHTSSRPFGLSSSIPDTLLLSFYAERADVIDKVHKYDKNTCGKIAKTQVSWSTPTVEQHSLIYTTNNAQLMFNIS